MSRQQWLNDAEANGQMHLLRQEENDRAYRESNDFEETKGDEARWRRLASSREPGWMPPRSAPAPRRASTPRRATPPVRPPPRLAATPRAEPVRHHLPSPREVGRPRPIQQRASQETRECSICVEDKTLDSFPQITAKCNHQATACSACIRSRIASILNGMNWSGISCLSSECTEVLQYEDMRRIAAPDIFQQYERYATRDAIGSLPNFRYCLNPKCTSGQEHMPGDNAMFICNACGHTACVTCNRSWHPDKTCAEADPRRRQAEDTLSLTKIRNTALRCPNSSCDVPIERN